MNLARWNQQPNLVQALAVFLESKAGQHFLSVLKHEFRPIPFNTPIVAGVDYMQVHAFRNVSREACQQVFDVIESMAIPKKKTERVPDDGWATRTLEREPEKEPPKVSEKSPRKKKT